MQSRPDIINLQSICIRFKILRCDIDTIFIYVTTIVDVLLCFEKYILRTLNICCSNVLRFLVCGRRLKKFVVICYKLIQNHLQRYSFGTINTDANAQVLNVLIFICKWQIWKRRNNLVYEQEFVEVEYLWKQCQWQFKNQINMLLRCSFIKGRCMKEVFHLLQNIQGEI